MEGKLKNLTDSSGHYQPGLQNMYLALLYLKDQGLDISEAAINLHEEIPSLNKIKCNFELVASLDFMARVRYERNYTYRVSDFFAYMGKRQVLYQFQEELGRLISKVEEDKESARIISEYIKNFIVSFKSSEDRIKVIKFLDHSHIKRLITSPEKLAEFLASSSEEEKITYLEALGREDFIELTRNREKLISVLKILSNTEDEWDAVFWLINKVELTSKRRTIYLTPAFEHIFRLLGATYLQERIPNLAAFAQLGSKISSSYERMCYLLIMTRCNALTLILTDVKQLIDYLKIYKNNLHNFSAWDYKDKEIISCLNLSSLIKDSSELVTLLDQFNAYGFRTFIIECLLKSITQEERSPAAILSRIEHQYQNFPYLLSAYKKTTQKDLFFSIKSNKTPLQQQLQLTRQLDS